jgi:hypothetical protein
VLSVSEGAVLALMKAFEGTGRGSVFAKHGFAGGGEAVCRCFETIGGRTGADPLAL